MKINETVVNLSENALQCIRLLIHMSPVSISLKVLLPWNPGMHEKEFSLLSLFKELFFRNFVKHYNRNRTTSQKNP